jgi:cytochrome o ubiquinol oxidase subunit 2
MNWAILNPQGIIALQERDLMLVATLLMLIIVIPVFIFTFYVVWKYRATKNPKKYTPNWDHSVLIEGIWWGIPCLIILILSVITWTSSHTLDPYRKIAADKAPLVVQVVALDWKWLFIYPEQGIATTNLLEIPVDRPISLEITADAPMNSFWIPQLAGQMYAMPGMSTELNIVANEPGDYPGSSANISGTGFAGMKFTARAVSEEDFEAWVASVRMSQGMLHWSEYEVLSKPSTTTPAMLYSMIDENLYDKIVMKFMTPMNHSDNLVHEENMMMPGMHMSH